MTKTKKQLRAEAVERLRSIPNEYMNAISVVVAIAGEAAYRLGGTRDARDMCIDLLTDDDSTTESLSDGTDSREKLEADAFNLIMQMIDEAYLMGEHEATWMGNRASIHKCIASWLDRQAAIDRAEFDKPGWEYCETCEEIARLRDENMNLARDLGECMADRDELREKLSTAIAHARCIARLIELG